MASSSLVPGNDPTLLFTNSGMVQFKDVFLGEEVRDYQRAVTSQRCVRAGGKHNDLENVGYTARHHTFFEMLGNFSFGDYFKENAIKYAWELLTVEFGLSPEKLWVTVFEQDDAAADIWINQIGVPPERVSRIGAKDNFWQMADTGPCGPCSEIFYDHGAQVAGGPPGTPDQDGDRFVEIWNLVFMQFNRSADGALTPLPKPSVDTGMGLERVAAVLQHVDSNYEIDLFQKLIKEIAGVLAVTDLESKSLRVIADHIRSTSFLMIDGVVPSNEGRGYVLRRIIRRAIRHGYQLGCRDAFMHKLVAPLAREMGDAYPELIGKAGMIENMLRQENRKFNQTLEQGLKILDREINQLQGDTLAGLVAFKLYDTYGFPVDLTADIAREHNLGVDHAGFDQAMDAQRNRARAASQFVPGESIKVGAVKPTIFSGYGALDREVEIVALIQDRRQVQRLQDGDAGIVVFSETPFYAESGGQVGDRGNVDFGETSFKVDDTRYLANKVIGHFGKVSGGGLQLQQTGTAKVDWLTRAGSANNHSATHLLHAALKRVLGDQVQQKGSLVDARHLRFDFSHHHAIATEQLQAIEARVNSQIRSNHDVVVKQMAIDAAKQAGAEALFGEKYDNQVRTIRMGDFSFELCGGTHVSRTGNIGFFKITAESGVAAGVRRIEAITGAVAEQAINAQLATLSAAASALKTTPEQLGAKLGLLLEKQKQLQKQIQTLQARLATSDATENVVSDINGIKVVALRQDDVDVKTMRLTVDQWKNQWKNKLQSGIVLVAGVNDGKVTMIAGVSKDIADRYQSGKLIAHLAPMVGGKGGGRPELAQGGGADTAQIDAALNACYHWVKDA